MNVGDYVGIVFMLLWGAYMLWLVNKGTGSVDTVVSLFTRWPTTHPKEFFVWMGITAVGVGLLCLLLFMPNDASRLAQQHLTSPGTFVEYHGDHANVSYTFMVGGQRYHGYSSSDKDNFAQIRAGAPFEVYYHPANPNINKLSEPVRSLILARVTITFFFGLLMGILAIIVRKLGVLVRKSSSTASNSVTS